MAEAGRAPLGYALPFPLLLTLSPIAHPGHVHTEQSSVAGHRRRPPGVVGLGQGPGHQRVRQVGATLDAPAALRLPVDLGHAFEVNEVAETQRRQVQPGLAGDLVPPGWRCPRPCRTPSSCQCRSPTPTTSPGLALRWGRRSYVVPVEGLPEAEVRGHHISEGFMHIMKTVNGALQISTHFVCIYKV